MSTSKTKSLLGVLKKNNILRSGGFVGGVRGVDLSAPYPYPPWAAFKEWNATEVALGWGGFDGIDWDIEGHDVGEAAGHGNVFTVEVLDLMGAMSVAAKRDGFTVTMAPSQSYLDPCTREFSRDTNFPPLEPWHEDFHYAGRNLYAYLVARFGAATFDLISVQLYEGWSSANHRITEGEAPAACLQRITQELLAGWEVDFSTDPEPRVAALGAVRIEIARQQLVIGLANGWCSNAKPDKFLLVTGVAGRGRRRGARGAEHCRT